MNTCSFNLANGACRWCGMYHGVRCPSVKAIEFEGDGITVKRVEFFAPNDYPQMSFDPNHSFTYHR